MESLVCGGDREKKGAKLKARLPWLFRDDPKVTPDFVDCLWKARNDAVHEANAEFSELLDGSKAPQIHLDDVEHLLAGVVVFSIAHLDRYDTVPSLWRGTMDDPSPYRLPPEMLIRRPVAITRFAVSQMVENMSLRFKGAARLFEACLNQTIHSPGNE